MEGQEPIQILLVDDHHVVRRGIRRLLDAESDMRVVGEESSGEGAVAAASQLAPNVVLMDIGLPGMDGIEATRLIRDRAAAAAVLAFSVHESDETFFAMIEAGATGYIPKNAAPEELLIAIRAVARGEVYVHSSVAHLLIHDLQSGAANPPPDDRALLESLSERERAVLVMVAEGMINKQMGTRLGISPKTVARHRENLMKKLALHSRTDLVKFAIRTGLIDAGGD
jgi:DNA-binding NarL/FixJ family response regulator